jgi:hypothetical protein
VKPSNSRSGLASIIVPRCKPLEFVRPCITVLARHTRQPWELNVADDGSTDHTSANLESVRDAIAVPVTVIANITRRGLQAAIYQERKTLSSNGTSPQVNHATHSATFADFPQLRAASREDTAQQPIPAQLLALTVPALGATAARSKMPAS